MTSQGAEARPSTCPACRSDNLNVRGHQHYGGGAALGGRFCFTEHDEITMQMLGELVCRHPWHTAASTPASEETPATTGAEEEGDD